MTSLFAALIAATLAAGASPLTLQPGSHLFIDDYLVAQSSGLVRKLHQPEKMADPILPKAEPWHEMPLFFQQVIKDPKTGRFRMWYNIRNNEKSMPHQVYAYAESDDGVRWRKPNLGLVEIAGSKDNNIYKVVPAFGLFFVDEGAASADPSRRYKMGFYSGKAPGLSVSFSPDGLRFTDWPQNPVLTNINDIIDGCWDPNRNAYLAIYGYASQPADGYKGRTPNAPEGYRRCVGQSTSKDFLNWTAPRKIVAADPNEPGVWEFYGAKPYVKGNLYVAFLRVLRDDLVAANGGPNEPMRQAGLGWTELMTSRDGENWTRYREPFIDRNREPGTFDHAMAWFGDWVTVGDQEYIYYCGYSEGHKIGKRQLALAKLRKNGFVSRSAGAAEGTLRTPLVALQGSSFTVNARVGGELRVRILDAAGNPLPGYDWSKPVRGDSLAHRIAWEGKRVPFKGKPVHLEFRLSDADLYAFDIGDR